MALATKDLLQLPDLVIANGQTTSDVISGDLLADFSSVLIAAPSTLPETVGVSVADRDPDDGAVAYRTLQSGGSDVTVGAGKAVIIGVDGRLPVMGLRLTAGGAVAAARTFKVVGARRVRS